MLNEFDDRNSEWMHRLPGYADELEVYVLADRLHASTGQKEGRFVTLEDGRVVFLGGPSTGAGGAYAGVPVDARIAGLTRDEYIEALTGYSLAQGMTADEVAQVKEWLKDVPDDDLSGLEGIYYARGEVWEQSGMIPGHTLRGNIFVSDWSPDSRAIGLYSPYRGQIYLSPEGFNGPTLLHELGHHVTMRNTPRDLAIRDIADKIIERHVAFRDAHLDDAIERSYSAGLRTYSFSQSIEFLADAYMVRRLADADINRALDAFWNVYKDPVDPQLREVLP